MGTRIGYWAAQEQYPPDKLLQLAVAAEKGGFETVVTSDHFQPWFNTNASGGFAWAWIASCAAMTKKIEIGTGVTAPDRYHPAVIAQAFATLGSMYPGRIMLGIGAGEAMSSIPLGIVFPSPGQRVRRLEDALEIITRLWSGNFEDYHGFFYQIHDAKLYTPPRKKIPLFVAAGGHHSAELAGRFGDGIIGFSGGAGEDVIKTAEDEAKKHGRDPAALEKLIEFKCSYDPDYDKALESVGIWRSTMVKGVLESDVSDPRKLEEEGKKEVSDKEIEGTWKIVSKVDELIKPIEDLVKQGYNRIQVHSSSPDEFQFVKQFTENALPILNQSMHPATGLKK
jgi:coenzyme F420-dependent glucose-6-phosphate dehydrogenase